MHWNSNLEARGAKREKYIAPKANDSFSQIRLSPYVQCSIVESQLWAYLRIDIGSYEGESHFDGSCFKCETEKLATRIISQLS